ncbi:hypothetical protein [Levilactobacillus sp. HBUAS70063]|uniref:hypothetical protein n=1 Tax=Levilactobacillus sp. HBUAS70063 TaxID=3109359 RepID=UPI0031330A19
MLELAASPFAPDELERGGQDALSLRSGLSPRLEPPKSGVSKSPFPNRPKPAAKGIPRLSSSGASLPARLAVGRSNWFSAGRESPLTCREMLVSAGSGRVAATRN